MKTQEIKLYTTIAIVCVNIFAFILSIFVLLSNVFANSKYGTALFLISAASAATVFLLRYRDKKIEELYIQSYSSAANELNDVKKKLADAEAKNKKLADDLKASDNSRLKSEYDALKEKCDTIEKYRNSFPLNIAAGYSVYNIIRTGINSGQCSNWKIIGIYADELWECDIIRPETQLYKDMLIAVGATKKPDEIQALNVGNEIFWA